MEIIQAVWGKSYVRWWVKIESVRKSADTEIPRAPSYFSTYFEEQIRREENGGDELKTLYIDRDPETFRDIALHLQGYHIEPRNGEHFVKLFADAQFYSRKHYVFPNRDLPDAL